VGLGDRQHDNDADMWINLVGTDVLPNGEMCLVANCTTTGVNSNLQWTNNAVHFGSSNTNNWIRIDKHYTPIPFTIEVVYSSSVSATGELNLVSNWQQGGLGFVLQNPQIVRMGRYINGEYKYTNQPTYQLNKIESFSGQLVDYGDDGCALGMYVSGEAMKIELLILKDALIQPHKEAQFSRLTRIQMVETGD
jgi:hypothetical protein